MHFDYDRGGMLPPGQQSLTNTGPREHVTASLDYMRRLRDAVEREDDD